jgi:hypothetical protein
MSEAENSVWPNDIVRQPRELDRDSPHHLVCFLLCPFSPKARSDLVHDAVRTACALCAQSAGIQIECRRADTLHEAKAIHDDIWRHIAAADLLVIDVSELNPNVMFEFGVAAALRRPTQVILVKSADDTSRLPFNAFAQRYLTYRHSIVGDQGFLASLHAAMIQAITPAPYVPTGAADAVGAIDVDFKSGDRPDLLLSPGMTHRRKVDEYLEYGSFHVFRNSWLLVTRNEYRDVTVCVQFRFAEIFGAPSEAWFGVSLRNQHFHANWGHLVFARADGKVSRGEPLDEQGNYQDVRVGALPGFDHTSKDFIEMRVSFSAERFCLKVGSVSEDIAINAMPHVYGSGRVRISTSRCRVQIRRVNLVPAG